MIWEGSLREGVTGLGDVIGKGGVESCKKVQCSLTSIEGQCTPMQITSFPLKNVSVKE